MPCGGENADGLEHAKERGMDTPTPPFCPNPRCHFHRHDRLAVFLVWRNYVKQFSERARDGTPAMRLGVTERPLTVKELLKRRRFPSQERLPRRWAEYYWRKVKTRQLPNGTAHRLKYAA